MCSAAVAALIALITPLPYSADFRPYFTIHDAAFAGLASGQLPDAANGLPRLLGVTNLYFLKVRLYRQLMHKPLPAQATCSEGEACRRLSLHPLSILLPACTGLCAT